VTYYFGATVYAMNAKINRNSVHSVEVAIVKPYR